MNRQRLISSLIEHEGIRNLVYEDSVGILTIGIGHNVEEVPLSNRAIEVICQDDIATAEGELDKNWNHWKANLNDARQNVLVEMVFNLGYPRFSKFVKFIEAVKAQNWPEAEVQMLDSRWAEQVGRRAINLANQMKSGQYYEI